MAAPASCLQMSYPAVIGHSSLNYSEAEKLFMRYYVVGLARRFCLVLFCYLLCKYELTLVQ